MGGKFQRTIGEVKAEPVELKELIVQKMDQGSAVHVTSFAAETIRRPGQNNYSALFHNDRPAPF